MTVRDETTRACDPARDETTLRIRALNDALRCRGRDGTLAVTDGVIALGSRALPAILIAVRQFDTFTDDNDPHGEHDFAAFEWNGHRLFWKIDYYDRDLRFGSPDPADASVTKRVLTIMLAGEY